MADSVTYEVEKRLGILSKSDNGWKKEVNLVSWNNGIVKMDIRDWGEEGTKMKKGITLTRSEVYTLFGILKHLDFGEIGDYANKGDKSAKYTKKKGADGAEDSSGDEEILLDTEYVCDKETANDTVPFDGEGRCAQTVAECDEDYN